MSDVMTDARAELRRQYITARESLAPAERQRAELEIITHLTAHLTAHPRLSQATTLAAFVGTRGEVNLTPFLKALLERQQLALPVVSPTRGHMKFHHVSTFDELTPNRYGILEPAATSKIIPPAELEMMLVPLVAFDASGNRLGMGGGYYDRYLAELEVRPYLLGVAFACQEAPALSTADWDVTLDAVVTEKGVLEFR